MIETTPIHDVDDDAPHADTELRWYPDKTTPLKGQLRFINAPRAYRLHWGDGQTEAGQPGFLHTHTYPAGGAYTPSVILQGDLIASELLRLRVLEGTTKPNVTVGVAGDKDYTIRVAFTDPEDHVAVGRFEITWGIGGDVQEIIGEPGTSIDRYFPAGEHKIRVKDHWSHMMAIHTVTIVDPVHDPDFTLTENPGDPDRRTVKLNVTNATGSGRTFTVDWGDGTTPETINATIGTTATHKYDFGDDYMVQIAYTDDTSINQAKFVTVPFTGA